MKSKRCSQPGAHSSSRARPLVRWAGFLTFMVWAPGLVWEAAASPAEQPERAVAASRHPKPAETFHFAILGDNAGGSRPGVHASAVEHLARMRPDFVISVGDLVDGFDADGGLVDAGKIDRRRRAFDAEIEGLGVPYYYVTGNNDNFTTELHDDWRARYGPTYYSFVHRGVLFVVLDSDDPPETWRGGIGEEQHTWLEGVLREHRAAAWTLIFLHRPLWLENPEAWRPVEAVLGARQRTVFAGHWHTYVPGEIGGHEYYVLATTGGISALSGRRDGSFDHLVWVAMTPEGPRLTNIQLSGIWDRDPIADVPGELTTRIRRQGIEVAEQLLAAGGPDPEDPGFGQVQMFALGRELAFEGRLDDAAVVFELLLAVNPNSWRGQEALGDIYRRRGENEQARQRYRRVVELMPANVYARDQLEALSE